MEERLTKEEKALVRAYLKMCIAKDWYKPNEFTVSNMVDNLNCRDEMELFIDKEWFKLTGSED